MEAEAVRPRVLAIALLVMSSVLAGCTAIGADGLLVISLPAYHVGDTASYVETSTWRDAEGNLSRFTDGTVLIIEPPTEVLDRWGRPAPTIPVRQDWMDGDEKYASSRCHMLAGGAQIIREDILEGMRRHVTNSLFGVNVVDHPQNWDIDTTTLFDGLCWVFPALSGRSLAEGDRISSADFLLSLTFLDILGESLPATPTTFEGRAALAFVFEASPDGASPWARLVLADGIAGLASLEAVWSEEDTFSARVLGFSQGNGLDVRYEGTHLADPPARIERQDADWMRFDDSAWPVRLRFDEALAAIHANPRGTQLAPFLAQHPDAVLWHAFYRGGETSEDGDRFADGTWQLGYSDGKDSLQCLAQRFAGSQTQGIPIPGAVQPMLVNCWGPDAGDSPIPIPTSFPAQVASTPSLEQTLAAHGLESDDVVNVRYWLQADGNGAVGHIQVETIPYYLGREYAGVSLQVENAEASLVDIRKIRGSTQVAPLAAAQTLPAPAPSIDRPDGATLIAVGGGALILGGLLLKLFIALFSRILGAQMLENPVRARIYEQIRAAPGAHREEIIEFAGIGNGATRHHLRKLTAHGFVFEVATGGFTRYYPAGEVPLHVAQEHAILRTGRARDVFELYTTHPDMTLREAARTLEMSAPSVHRVLKRLQREGLLVNERARISR